MAAEALPRDHVGPHLPPGGWMPSNPGGTTGKQASAQASLPALNGPKPRPPSVSTGHVPQSLLSGIPILALHPTSTLSLYLAGRHLIHVHAHSTSN